MKKIPTMFKRVYENHKIIECLSEFTQPEFEEVLKHGIATVKYDGSCCAIINGELYKRYDCKKRRTVPKDAIPCSEPDPITGHWPHWVKVSDDNPADKWFIKAHNYTLSEDNVKQLSDGTYEAIGPHFQDNLYKLQCDRLIKHGKDVFYLSDDERTFDGIKHILELLDIEGFVFWFNGEPVCKIKRSDFGLKWPNS